MKVTPLTSEEQRATGFTHKVVLTYADAAAATTAVGIAVLPYTAFTLIDRFAWYQSTVFDGTTVQATLSVGWNGATTDDPDGILQAVQISENGTEVMGSSGNGAAFGAPQSLTDEPLTGYLALDAGNIEVVFTATAGSLSAFTSGEMHLFFRLVDLTKL